MHGQTLNGMWQMRATDGADWLPATVPGSNYTDLMAAGKIPDPFWAQNEKDVQWVADRDWEYRREFTVEPGLLDEDRVELVCLGLDTLAELTLNGHVLGQTDNMFRTYRWPVKGRLVAGVNTLSIVFRSPVRYINQRQAARKLPTIMNPGMAFIRKVQSHFGWDWGPRLPQSGIWRAISLQGFSGGRLADVNLRQQHQAGRVTVSADVAVEAWGGRALTLRLVLRGPDGQTWQAEAPARLGQPVRLELSPDQPQLWWPNGLGPQPLYHVAVELLDEGRALDQQAFQLGLRKLELRQTPDAWGKTFTVVVNDVPVFARGADWIPADAFPTRLTRERYDAWLRDAAAANMNMLRLWGGGYFEDEAFYDLCDQYGLLIWHDFMFACVAYPLDEADFLENVRLEVDDNVRRLRHRACVALWCGNNEIEMIGGMWKGNKPLTRAYERYFHHLLPEQVAQLDPDHPYWFSSPSSGDLKQRANLDAVGDTHLWQVWHGLKPFTFFRQRFTRFASEFGLESLPAPETIAAFGDPGETRLDSKIMLHHQRSEGGNDKILYYLLGRFRRPRDLSDLAYLSQIQQAEAMRIGVEHWRRNSPRCSGALYWQLNDCWPVTSWASVDYFGRWKALQYAARRFYAPLALSLEDEGSRVRVFVANDTRADWRGTLRWSLETLQGETVKAGEKAAAAPLLAPVCLEDLDFTAELQQYGAANLVFWAALYAGEKRLVWQVALFAAERTLNLPAPQIEWQTSEAGGQLVVSLKTKALARFAWLQLEGASPVFSDNFFDLPAGWNAQVMCPMPPGWTLAQAQKALRVRSLADVVPAGAPLFDRLAQTAIALKPASLLMTLFLVPLMD